MAKRSYEVCGTQPVLGNEPGERFSAELTDEQEKFYLDGGHLKKASTHSGDHSASKSGGDSKETK